MDEDDVGYTRRDYREPDYRYPGERGRVFSGDGEIPVGVGRRLGPDINEYVRLNNDPMYNPVRLEDNLRLRARDTFMEQAFNPDIEYPLEAINPIEFNEARNDWLQQQIDAVDEGSNARIEDFVRRRQEYADRVARFLYGPRAFTNRRNPGSVFIRPDFREMARSGARNPLSTGEIGRPRPREPFVSRRNPPAGVTPLRAFLNNNPIAYSRQVAAIQDPGSYERLEETREINDMDDNSENVESLPGVRDAMEALRYIQHNPSAARRITRAEYLRLRRIVFGTREDQRRIGAPDPDVLRRVYGRRPLPEVVDLTNESDLTNEPPRQRRRRRP